MFSTLFALTGLDKVWGYLATGGAIALALVLGYFKARSDGANAVKAQIAEKRAEDDAKTIQIQTTVSQLGSNAVTEQLRPFTRD